MSRQSALAIVESVRSRARAQPEQRISLEQAAADAGLSPVRLHQIFQEIHGENFGAFIRRVRLEYAIGLMRAFPDRACTMIAHDSGFSESSDFTRTFKRTYGVAPSRWDRVRPLTRERSAIEDESSPDQAFAGYPDSPEHAASPVTVQDIPRRRAALLNVAGAADMARLAAAFDALERWLLSNGEIREERRFIGVSYDSDLDTPPELYRFELAYEVGPDAKPSGDVVVRDLPACQAAVLPCRGGMTEFVAAWDHLQRGFLPRSNWVPGIGPQMEIYYADPRKTRMKYWDMDCVLPVRREGDGHE